MILRGALPLLLLGCAQAPVVADLNLVAVPSAFVEVQQATVALDRLVLGPCDGEPLEVLVGYRLNLLQPEPIPVPVDTYCEVGLELAPDPFDGALRLQGRTSSTDFELRLDPGLVVRDRSVGFGLDSEAILALDLALFLETQQLDALEDRELPVTVEPDDPLAPELEERIAPALVFLSSPEEAASTYVDLWPDFDFSVEARVDASGCDGGAGTVVYEPPSVDPPDPIATPVDGEDPPPTRSGGDGCGSCAGDGRGCACGGGEGRGCGCGGGCDAACSTSGFAPVGWVALLALVTVRRRHRRAGEAAM